MDYSYGTGFHLPVEATHAFPVTPSSIVPELYVNRSGLVRLWRRIAVRINSAPSLNFVLVIATR